MKEVGDPFEDLRRRFLARCRSDAEQLLSANDDTSAITAIVHRLSGSAGTFGYAELSSAADLVEMAILEDQPHAEPLGKLMRIIEALQDV